MKGWDVSQCRRIVIGSDGESMARYEDLCALPPEAEDTPDEELGARFVCLHDVILGLASAAWGAQEMAAMVHGLFSTRPESEQEETTLPDGSAGQAGDEQEETALPDGSVGVG